ncbi:MAG TPA: hypothetical protein VGI81_01580 [Tepidisphaeraceae bacterium]
MVVVRLAAERWVGGALEIVRQVDAACDDLVQCPPMIAFASQDLGLRPAQWKEVERKARQAGKTTPEYLRLLIEQDLLAEKTFEEILRPVRRDFKKSGITETELDAIVSRARHRPAGARRKAVRRPKRETPRQ